MGTLGTNQKKDRNPLSSLNKSVPKTTGDKPFLTGNSGDSQIQGRSLAFGQSGHVAKPRRLDAKKPGT